MAGDVRVTGIDRFTKAVLDLKLKADLGARKIVEQGGVLIANRAKLEFREGKGPPQPPRPTSRTHNLRNSIQTLEVRKDAEGWSSKTGPTAIYGRRIELGYPQGVGPGHQMTRPFPYMEPGFKKALPEIDALAKLVWAGVRP